MSDTIKIGIQNYMSELKKESSFLYADCDGKQTRLLGDFSDISAFNIVKHIIKDRPSLASPLKQWLKTYKPLQQDESHDHHD